MHSFYEFEQLVKMKQKELFNDRHTRPRPVKPNEFSGLLQRIRIFSFTFFLQDQVCCTDQICCSN